MISYHELLKCDEIKKKKKFEKEIPYQEVYMDLTFSLKKLNSDPEPQHWMRRRTIKNSLIVNRSVNW